MTCLYKKISLTDQWTEEEKLHYLLVPLKEEAAEYFDLEDEILVGFNSLFHGLTLILMKALESMSMKRLVFKGFQRDVSVEVREDMTLKQLFDGLLRFHVKILKHPRNIDHSVELL